MTITKRDETREKAYLILFFVVFACTLSLFALFDHEREFNDKFQFCGLDRKARHCDFVTLKNQYQIDFV